MTEMVRAGKSGCEIASEGNGVKGVVGSSGADGDEAKTRNECTTKLLSYGVQPFLIDLV